MKTIRLFIVTALCMMLGYSMTLNVEAKTVTLSNGEVFDSDFYAELYPDVKAAYGTDADLLLQHYLVYGMKEGRIPSEQASASNVITPTLVSIDELDNKASLKKKCTDAEFQAAYDAAAAIVSPLVGKTTTEQLQGIQSSLRAMVDNGQVAYTTSIQHYNDPYGYFCVGVSSCAGCARATGLCLNMLGISYEHVNENQWSHQWCRVNVDGTYWICDPYGLYVGQEPSPYAHPYIY